MSEGGEEHSSGPGQGADGAGGLGGADPTPVKPQAELGRAEAERIALQISARSLSTARRSVGSPIAVRDRLHVAGERDLLLARCDRGARARAHAGRLPDRGAAVRADGDDVRRGRLAAPGARRLDGVRALRLQRARQLRRGLGDPARLRDPDRGHGVLGDAVPARVLEPARATAPRRSGWRSCSSRSSCSATSAASAGGARGASAMLVVGRPRAAGLIVVLGLVLFFNPHTLLDPIHLGSAPTLVGSDLRADGRRDRLHRASSRRRGWPARCGSAAPACKRLVGSGTATVVFIYVGIALVAVTALPVHDGHTRWRRATSTRR